MKPPDLAELPRLTPQSSDAGRLPLIVASVTVVLIVMVFTYPIASDEIEHVHAGWLVAQGHVPYRDFFEHHHPLLWFVIAGLLPFLPESSVALIVIRAAFLAGAVLLLAVTWSLAWHATRSPRIAWLSVVLLLSSATFLTTAVRVRPDPPMTLLGTLAVLLALRGFTDRRRVWCVGAGVAAGLAVLVLQKALLLVGASAAVAVLAWWRGHRFRWKQAVWAGAGFVMPIGLGVVYLVATASAREYAVTNWAFNVASTADQLRLPAYGVYPSGHLWMLAIWGGLAACVRRQDRSHVWVPAAAGLFVVAGLVCAGAIRATYLLQALPLLSVAGAWFLQGMFDRRGVSPRVQAWVFVCFIVPPLVHVGQQLATPIRPGNPDRAAIDYVLEHSAPGDPVYDARCRFNLFRPDLHYLGGLPLNRPDLVRWYSRVAGPEFAGYDRCALIEVGRPVFVFDDDGVIRECRLGDRYAPTSFARIHVRVD